MGTWHFCPWLSPGSPPVPQAGVQRAFVRAAHFESWTPGTFTVCPLLIPPFEEQLFSLGHCESPWASEHLSASVGSRPVAQSQHATLSSLLTLPTAQASQFPAQLEWAVTHWSVLMSAIKDGLVKNNCQRKSRIWILLYKAI